MPHAHADHAEPNRAARSAAARAWLFFRRWLANPLEMGSIVPSSPALGRRVAAAVRAGPPGGVVELGAGTGAITRALIEGGIAPSRLTVVEIVPEMAAVLRATFPGVTVLCGDAWRLPALLAPDRQGGIGAVVCGIPLVLLPLARQRALVEAIQAVAPGRGFLHYTYCITSPLPARKLGLRGRRVAWTPANLPPASVWHYAPMRPGRA
ncbi:methyltransferase domain-containing protein [Elioraea sp. Yellowstone]|jgi:phosphatidylethanolamine/phosphatidyl-N-methylethanolamine N-methyltransferase|uniref:class I SAM-dependent methyltransferase n=1 Tax=Elioraea sp. Yellowstone TaxID=2592070 RepID=UPI00114E40B7|nr:methyltransferase domain-containing protein [Elioraea sp. Yellowstone]TQF76515.1 methyltransferase domain-containing protein [Elioraea sp. Yellowstone]